MNLIKDSIPGAMHDVRPFALTKENVTYGSQSKNYVIL
jgi:hypothetical protein